MNILKREKGFKRLRSSFKHAFEGLLFALRHELNLRIHFAAAITVLIVGLLIGVEPLEFCVLAIFIVLVIVAELINTAFEDMVNLLAPYYSEHAKRAKDILAGAVLVCAVFAAIVGLIIFIPHIAALFQ